MPVYWIVYVRWTLLSGIFTVLWFVAVSSAKDISLPYLPWVLGHRNYKYPMSQGKCSLSCRHKLRKCQWSFEKRFFVWLWYFNVDNWCWSGAGYFHQLDILSICHSVSLQKWSMRREVNEVEEWELKVWWGLRCNSGLGKIKFRYFV